MKEFQRKTKMKKKLCSNFVIFILVMILAFMIRGALSLYFKAQDGRKMLETDSVSLLSLEDRAEKLKSDLDYYRSDVGREEKLRNNFVVAKEGEQAIFIIDEEEEEVLEEDIGTFQNIWQKIINLVK